MPIYLQWLPVSFQVQFMVLIIIAKVRAAHPVMLQQDCCTPLSTVFRSTGALSVAAPFYGLACLRGSGRFPQFYHSTECE